MAQAIPFPVYSRRASMPPQEADVTVVIPTHHRPELLRRALRSVQRQTYTAFEVLVIADGEDGVEAQRVLDDLKDPRVRLVPLWARRGGAQARNIGVRMAKTPWIALLDDDDEWEPEKLALQREAADHIRTTFPVITSQSLVKSTGFAWVSPGRVLRPGEEISEFLFCRHRCVDGAQYLQTSTLFVPRELLLKLPLRAHLRRHQDWDWLLRAATVPGVAFHMIAQPLTIYHVDEGRNSVSRNLDWEFSRAWAAEMRRAFTPRAYSFFLATECASRVAKARAGRKASLSLMKAFCFDGRPTARSTAMLAGFLLLPSSLREWFRRRARELRGPATAVTRDAVPT